MAYSVESSVISYVNGTECSGQEDVDRSVEEILHDRSFASTVDSLSSSLSNRSLNEAVNDVLLTSELCSSLREQGILEDSDSIYEADLEFRRIMNAVKLEVQWSPHDPERFITFGSDLCLYQVEEITEDFSKISGQTLSDKYHAELLFTNSNHQYLKCVAWCPNEALKHLLAVGLANGKMVLTSFAGERDPDELIGREFVPRHSRQCNSLSWNPEECNLIASGLDKVKMDHSILIWDITKSGKQGDGDRRPMASMSDVNSMTIRPLVDLGHSELCHSLQWFQHQPKTLVAGMSNKYLKIFDLRDATKHHNLTPTKAVYGVSVDPFSEHRVASFSENQVTVWDVRNFEKPILLINEARPTIKVAWCPTRNNLLASISKDAHVVKLYDVQHVPINTEEVEPIVFERFMQPCIQSPVSSFSWHPTSENRMLILTCAGSLSEFLVFERITLNWSPPNTLTWNSGMKTLYYIDDSPFFENLQDIAVLMKQRALAGYGLQATQDNSDGGITTSTCVSIDALPKDDKIERLWTWIDMVKGIQEDPAFKSSKKSCSLFQGVRDIICSNRNTNGGSTSTKSDQLSPAWGSQQSSRTNFPKMFLSEERERALRLCGWGFDKDGIALSKFLERLEAEEMFERAAAIAIFNMKIHRAIEALKKGALHRSQPAGTYLDLNLVAMAVAGYTESGLWKDMCNILRQQLSNPYLRALFAFLTCDDDSYGEVLNETGMAIQDRVAFSCLFLSDNKLTDFLSKLTTKMIDFGNLDGILLTGLTLEGIELLQQYLDMTGDVQTPCMVIMQALGNGLGSDTRVKQWVESYRNLLDQWRLWHKRAEFDIQWNQSEQVPEPSQHVFISCIYCSKSISSFVGTQSSGGIRMRPNIYGNKTKMASCPNCRKPLPRCALCLIHMGTAAGMGMNKVVEDEHENKITKFSAWFTWCQTCWHGGHSEHILDWFKDHVECPVTSCNCKCMSLDSVGRVNTCTS